MKSWSLAKSPSSPALLSSQQAVAWCGAGYRCHTAPGMEGRGVAAVSPGVGGSITMADQRVQQEPVRRHSTVLLEGSADWSSAPSKADSELASRGPQLQGDDPDQLATVFCPAGTVLSWSSDANSSSTALHPVLCRAHSTLDLILQGSACDRQSDRCGRLLYTMSTAFLRQCTPASVSGRPHSGSAAPRPRLAPCQASAGEQKRAQGPSDQAGRFCSRAA